MPSQRRSPVPYTVSDSNGVTTEVQAYALEFTIECGRVGEPTAEEAYTYLTASTTTPYKINEQGSTITTYSIEGANAFDDVQLAELIPPSPPPSPCVGSDWMNALDGISIRGAAPKARFCYQLKNGFSDACETELYYVPHDADAWDSGDYSAGVKHCVNNRMINGKAACSNSDYTLYMCPPSAPATDDASGGLVVADQQINAEDGASECDDCVSGGAVAGISIGTFFVGLVIGGLGAVVFFQGKTVSKLPA